MRFEKISRQQFRKDAALFVPDVHAELTDMDKDALERAFYDTVSLPKRVTAGSAGYDVASPIRVHMQPGIPKLIPTGLRVQMDDGYFLAVVPRSGLGFKYGLRLMNTVGIIDRDYYSADNEGHILLKVVCDAPFDINAGDRIAQAIFVRYGTTDNEMVPQGERHGGFGSTGVSV